MAIQVLVDLGPDHLGTLFPDGRGGVHGLAFPQRTGENRHGRFRLFVCIRDHADRVKAEGVCKHKRSAGSIGEKGREHGTVQAL